MEPDSPSPHVSGGFPTTGWTLVRAVGDRAHPEHQQALDRFARLYGRPVFCFLRARGCPVPEAEDLAQEFFVSLLSGDWVGKADPQRGRFRVFLRMHLRSFLADQISPRRVRRQRHFERQLVSLDGGDRSYEPASGETPEQAFDRALAQSIVQAVRQALRQNCATENRLDHYEVFAAAYPEDSDTEPASQQALAERFGKTRDEVRGILERMKKRVLRLLRNELRADGGSEEAVEAEAAELLQLLAR
jgi:RNA polymerase sigma-70 factor (ECF subfamily)